MADLLGYPATELQGMLVRETTHPEDRLYSVYIVDRALRHNEEPQEELKRYLHKDGHIVWVLLETTLKRDPSGTPTHFLSFLEDVTRRIQTEPLPRVMAKRLQSLQEQERQRLSEELHEELGQVLCSLKLELDWLREKLHSRSQPRAQRLSLLVDGILASTRRLWQGLRPSILDELGLEAAIDWLLRENCDPQGIPWVFTPPDKHLRLDSVSRVGLFRFCQECLTLLLSTPQPTVHVHMSHSASQIGLSLGADGPTALNTEGAQMRAIQDRVATLGGQLSLQLHPPLLRVTMPLINPSQDADREKEKLALSSSPL